MRPVLDAFNHLRALCFANGSPLKGERRAEIADAINQLDSAMDAPYVWIVTAQRVLPPEQFEAVNAAIREQNAEAA